jgi:CheY-like chemotaxis protein
LGDFKSFPTATTCIPLTNSRLHHLHAIFPERTLRLRNDRTSGAWDSNQKLNSQRWVLNLEGEGCLETSSVRILVVDDYEPFRRFVCSTLGKRPEVQVICEESDGLEAVLKAEELQPDLILLDIGLPTLNGIEAARRIRKLSPESEILFVSQESSADVVQEALSLGAWGYVVKAKAASELLAAAEAVLLGRQFVTDT